MLRNSSNIGEIYNYLISTQDLISKLKRIEKGGSGKAYENFTHLILNYLFCTDSNPEKNLGMIKKAQESSAITAQDKTDSGRNIRDFILPNFATLGFWRYVRERYKGEYIVVDCKNYTEGIGKREIIDVAHYMIEEGCGLFGLICTRSEIQNSAKTALLGQWLHYKKMIVCLSDQDLINMLLLKEEGNDPNLIIKEKITSFRKGID